MFYYYCNNVDCRTKQLHYTVQLKHSNTPMQKYEHILYSEFDTSTIQMRGYRTDYNVSDVIDLNNATCQQVTTPESDTPFLLTIELPTYYKPLIVTAVLDGDCLDFPATMVYTEGDRSVMVPYGNNPSFCENIPGTCAFDCDCSDKGCRLVTLTLLNDPRKPRRLCEVYITSKNVATLVVNADSKIKSAN